VVRIDKDEVLVDIGYKSEGVIPSGELSIRKSVDPREEVELGEEVDAIVLTKEDQDGRLIMSKKRARFEKAWRRIEAAAESGQPVEGSVIEVVKGGLIIDLGVRGFLPASLVDIRRVPNLDEYMGTKIETKVIELNRSRNNVVLSRRAVLEEERKEVRQQILDRLQPGLVVEGQISNIVDFGAFVDLDGIDGLIHISELSWSHVNHPSEILNIGDTVQVKVLDIDRDRQRISLGLKQTQEDPWQRIVDTYNVGDELEGTVTKVVTFGAFVEILDGVEGLVHISELAAHHVESPREVVHPGDEIRVKILEIDSERRRLSLSAKRVEDQILPLPRPAGAPGGEAPVEEPAAEAAQPEAETAGSATEGLEVPDGQPDASGGSSTELEAGADPVAVEQDASVAQTVAVESEASVAETGTEESQTAQQVPSTVEPDASVAETGTEESQTAQQVPSTVEPDASVAETGTEESQTAQQVPSTVEPDASVAVPGTGGSEIAQQVTEHGAADGATAVEGGAADAATETAQPGSEPVHPTEQAAEARGPEADAGESEPTHPRAAAGEESAAAVEEPESAAEVPAPEPDLTPAASDSPQD
jgi:small subunit ribosomal protein S1